MRNELTSSALLLASVTVNSTGRDQRLQRPVASLKRARARYAWPIFIESLGNVISGVNVVISGLSQTDSISYFCSSVGSYTGEFVRVTSPMRHFMAAKA